MPMRRKPQARSPYLWVAVVLQREGRRMSTTSSLLRRPQALVCLCVLTVLGFACSPTPVTHATAEATPRTIISLTFDDGLASHITAMAMMRAHGVVGTFYINPEL